MRKVIPIFILIALVLALPIGLVACNNATPQGQLANLLDSHKHERFTYVVTSDYEGVSGGALTVTLDAYSIGEQIEDCGRYFPFNGKGDDYNHEVKNDCIMVESILEVTVDGSVYKESYGCIYELTTSSTTYMVPQRCYRRTIVDGKPILNTSGQYEGNYFRFTRTVNGVTLDTESVLSLGSGAKLDNNEFQQVLRSVTTYNSGLTLSFTTPVVAKDEAAVVTLTASASYTAVPVKGTPFGDNYSDTFKDDGINCYKVTLTRSTQVEGKTETLYYAQSEVKYNGWTIKQPLIKFEEPLKKGDKEYTVTYSLKTAEID